MLNFRSKGESNESVKQELKEAKLRKSLLSESSSVATLKTKSVMKNEQLKKEVQKEFKNSLLPSLMKEQLYAGIDLTDSTSNRPRSSLQSPSQLNTWETVSLGGGSIDGSQAGHSSLGSLSNLSEILGTGDSIDSILEEYYHEGLVKLFNKYTNQSKERADIDGHETAEVLESSLDLGLVSVGTKVKVTLLLKSLASDKLSIDITCRNFPDNTKMLTHSSGVDTRNRMSKNTIIPGTTTTPTPTNTTITTTTNTNTTTTTLGFNRLVTIDFTIDTNTSALCFIDIACNPIYRGPGHAYNASHYISVPVLYRIKTKL